MSGAGVGIEGDSAETTTAVAITGTFQERADIVGVPLAAEADLEDGNSLGAVGAGLRLIVEEHLAIGIAVKIVGLPTGAMIGSRSGEGVITGDCDQNREIIEAGASLRKVTIVARAKSPVVSGFMFVDTEVDATLHTLGVDFIGNGLSVTGEGGVVSVLREAFFEVTYAYAFVVVTAGTNDLAVVFCKVIEVRAMEERFVGGLPDVDRLIFRTIHERAKMVIDFLRR